MTLKMLAQTLALACAATLATASAQAQEYPSKPIRLLVGFSAGGGTDTLARVYAKGMQEVLNTPVIVENKPGASQLLAIQPLLSSAPDGYTLVMATGSALLQGPGVRDDLPFDPLKDFSLIARVATGPGVISVSPNSTFKTFSQFVEYAKANPGELNYGSAGVGAANHLQTEYLASITGISMTHIPYKSDQEVIMQVTAGDIDVGLTVAQAAINLAKDGRILPIAVTSSERLSALPDVPTLGESSIPGLEEVDSYTFYALVGPANMPSEIIAKLNEAANKVSAMPEISSLLRDTLLFQPVSESPEEYRQYMEREMPKWKKLGKELDLKFH